MNILVGHRQVFHKKDQGFTWLSGIFDPDDKVYAKVLYGMSIIVDV